MKKYIIYNWSWTVFNWRDWFIFVSPPHLQRLSRIQLCPLHLPYLLPLSLPWSRHISLVLLLRSRPVLTLGISNGIRSDSFMCANFTIGVIRISDSIRWNPTGTFPGWYLYIFIMTSSQVVKSSSHWESSTSVSLNPLIKIN